MEDELKKNRKRPKKMEANLKKNEKKEDDIKKI
jgi:hypothetical protein